MNNETLTNKFVTSTTNAAFDEMNVSLSEAWFASFK